MALIMYDLDGTLLDTAKEITLAVNLTLQHFSHGSVSDIEVQRWIGHGTGFLMQQAWAATGTNNDRQHWDAIMKKFGQNYEETAGTSSRPYPEVIETLALLKGKGFKQAIITNKETRYTEKIIAAHGLGQYMDMVICGDTLPIKKPDPGVIDYCLHELDVMSGQALFVGDSETDLATAKAAGIVFWAVPYGYNHGRSIAMADPGRVIPDISYVTSYFEGM
jgi:phosphoglycolate phosphatase